MPLQAANKLIEFLAGQDACLDGDCFGLIVPRAGGAPIHGSHWAPHRTGVRKIYPLQIKLSEREKTEGGNLFLRSRAHTLNAAFSARPPIARMMVTPPNWDGTYFRTRAEEVASLIDRSASINASKSSF
jgi:hypothetical protein